MRDDEPPGPAVRAVSDIPERAGAPHPVAAAERCRERRKQALSDAVGIDQFGVNRVTLPPGVWSTVRHWHSHEDEFVLILEGTPTLVTDAGARALRPGDCVGFKAGVANGHRIENRAAAPAVYLDSRYPRSGPRRGALSGRRFAGGSRRDRRAGLPPGRRDRPRPRIDVDSQAGARLHIL